MILFVKDHPQSLGLLREQAWAVLYYLLKSALCLNYHLANCHRQFHLLAQNTHIFHLHKCQP